MSRDGLLPEVFSAMHPKFRTPWISTLMVGTCVAFLAASLPIDLLGDMVNIGTLLAFAIVCAGVWIIRRRTPILLRPFRTPWCRLFPSWASSFFPYLMDCVTCRAITWLRLFVWLIIGIAITSVTDANTAACSR